MRREGEGLFGTWGQSVIDVLSNFFLVLIVATGAISLVWDRRNYSRLGFHRDEAVSLWIGWIYVITGSLLFILSRVIRILSF